MTLDDIHRVILEMPADDLPRLVAADFLDDIGKSTEAAIIRHQVSNPAESSEVFLTWPFTRETESIRAFRNRGYIDAIFCTADQFRRHVRGLFAAHPLRTVVIESPVVDVNTIFETGHVGSPHILVPDDLGFLYSTNQFSFSRARLKSALESMGTCYRDLRNEHPEISTFVLLELVGSVTSDLSIAFGRKIHKLPMLAQQSPYKLPRKYKNCFAPETIEFAEIGDGPI